MGDGPPTIIVLHGGPGLSHDYLRPEWDRLAAVGRVIYYDQRGCGRSGDEAPYGWRQDVADLQRVIDRVAPNRPVILAGSSWGSWLALLFALREPNRVSGMILSGTPPWWHPGPEAQDERAYRENLRRWMRRNGEPDYLARADSINEGLVPIRRQARTRTEILADMPEPDTLLATRLSRATQVDCRDAAAARSALWYDLPRADRLANIRHPVLFVWGANGRMIRGGVPRIAQILPLAQVRVIDDAGHDAWLDQPDRFFAVADSFVAALGPADVP